MGNTKNFGDYLVTKWLDIKKKFMIGGVEVTATAAELNKLHGATPTTAELNILAGVTATAAELNLVDLSAVGALVKVKKIAVAAGDWSAETDSGWDLPAKALLLDVFVDVKTLQAGKTVNIGTLSSEAGGDTDGFAAALSLAELGLIRPQAARDGTNAWFAANTRGALLSNYNAGTNADDRGLYQEKPYPSTANTAKSVVYQTNTAVTAVFDIYLVFIELG